MKRIFVCSPYAGNIELNTVRAIGYCLEEIQKGNCPFAPHLFFPRILDEHDPKGRAKGIALGIKMMQACEAVHVYGDQATEGMMIEIRAAKNIGIPVVFIDTKDMEVV